jgi:hypothetical protein
MMSDEVPVSLFPWMYMYAEECAHEQDYLH